MNHDNIQNPQHYTNQGVFECIDVMRITISVIMQKKTI